MKRQSRTRVIFTEEERAEIATLTLTKRIAKIWATRGALNTQELSVMLGISPKTLFKMAKAGRIPSFHVGGAVRYDGRLIVEWLRQQRNG